MTTRIKNAVLATVTVALGAINATVAHAGDSTGRCTPGLHHLCITNGGGGYCPGNPYGACVDAYVTTWGCNVYISNYEGCWTGSGECSWNVDCTLSAP